MRAGLSAYSKLFSDAYADKNLRMNNILPGFIDSVPENPDWKARIPMQLYGRAHDEIAATMAFFASDGGAYITGPNIHEDRGLTRAV